MSAEVRCKWQRNSAQGRPCLSNHLTIAMALRTPCSEETVDKCYFSDRDDAQLVDRCDLQSLPELQRAEIFSRILNARKMDFQFVANEQDKNGPESGED
jgi:hypothetical protein